MNLAGIRNELQGLADPDVAAFLARYFRTGPGEYGEGDRFLGIRVPRLRAIARRAREVSVPDALGLLSSEWHEERLLALLILVERYRRGGQQERNEIHRAYLASTRYVNNWDLVDASAPHIVGAHLRPDRLDTLESLARSSSVWERRIAMLATLHWIRQKEFRPALAIATLLIDDRHDLIHKAVGWMLREIGKRDQEVEERFLRSHHRTMPRTMLRYAIERFPAAERQAYLRGLPGSGV